MVNEHGTAEMEKMTSIEETLESRFRTPTEIVFHMPYNWDVGLEKLDEQRVEYAIFLYTDMFGPESTVIHNVTRGVFGGIEEYNYCPGVPLSDNGCQYHGSKYISCITKRAIQFLYLQNRQDLTTHYCEIYL